MYAQKYLSRIFLAMQNTFWHDSIIDIPMNVRNLPLFKKIDIWNINDCSKYLKSQ